MIVPANDDAIRAVKLICARIADSVIDGKGIQVVAPKEEEIAAAEAAAKAAPAAPAAMEATLTAGPETDTPDE